MNFKPQRYKIEDKIGQPFIDWDEIEEFLTVRPSQKEVDIVIEQALNKERLSLAQTAILLNAPNREAIFTAAETLKKTIYGNRIVLFAPLYVGNMCSNSCDYCSFRAENQSAARKTLSPSELEAETTALVGEGHKRLILVYGEHRLYDANFIAQSVRKVYENHNIRRVNINAAPFSIEDFKTIGDAGIGTFQIFQETYNPVVYHTHHLRGNKANYEWRLTALDRAMQGGIDDVGLGALFGLHPNWRGEVLGLVRHTNHLEACFNVGPHTISFPRITAAQGATPEGQTAIGDEDFMFLIAVLRLAVPYAGLILTAREKASLRDHAIRYGVSQIDGGTRLEIGGYRKPYNDHEKDIVGQAQFSLNDNRSLGEIIAGLVEQQRIPSFCTACYRKGRTGEHFMEFSTKGFIKRFCTPNAVLSFAEYLEDYAQGDLKEQGYALIEREIANLRRDDDELRSRIEDIRHGARDLFY